MNPYKISYGHPSWCDCLACQQSKSIIFYFLHGRNILKGNPEPNVVVSPEQQAQIYQAQEQNNKLKQEAKEKQDAEDKELLRNLANFFYIPLAICFVLSILLYSFDFIVCLIGGYQNTWMTEWKGFFLNGFWFSIFGLLGFRILYKLQ